MGGVNRNGGTELQISEPIIGSQNHVSSSLIRAIQEQDQAYNAIVANIFAKKAPMIFTVHNAIHRIVSRQNNKNTNGTYGFDHTAHGFHPFVWMISEKGFDKRFMHWKQISLQKDAEKIVLFKPLQELFIELYGNNDVTGREKFVADVAVMRTTMKQYLLDNNIMEVIDGTTMPHLLGQYNKGLFDRYQALPKAMKK